MKTRGDIVQICQATAELAEESTRKAAKPISGSFPWVH